MYSTTKPLGEMKQNNSHYIIQGHSRSTIWYTSSSSS